MSNIIKPRSFGAEHVSALKWHMDQAYEKERLNSALSKSNAALDGFQFWGSPVIKQFDGTLICPGFSGRTFSNRPFDRVDIRAANIDDNGKIHTGSDKIESTPGICEVTVRKGRRHDVKCSPGAHGGTITMLGLIPAEIEINIRIWTPDQFRQLQRLWLKLFPRPEKQTIVTKKKVPGPPREERNANPRTGEVTIQTFATYKTVDVVDTKYVEKTWELIHSALQTHNISAAIFTGGEGPHPGRAQGERVFIMRAREFLPVDKKASSAAQTPVAAKGSVLDAPLIAQPGFNPANTGAE